MAELFVKNSLNTRLSVKFNVSIKQFTITNVDGDNKWLLEVATTYLDLDGYNMRPKLIHLQTLNNLEAEIELAVEEMCVQIDWGILDTDKEEPYIFEYAPIGNDAPISSNIVFTIKDLLPSSGIDLSDIDITLDNGTQVFNITNETTIVGDPYEYNFVWAPANRVYNTYGD